MPFYMAQFGGRGRGIHLGDARLVKTISQSPVIHRNRVNIKMAGGLSISFL
jgi:hypothetical protein